MGFSPLMAQNPPIMVLGRGLLSFVGSFYKSVLFYLFLAGSFSVRPLFAASNGKAVTPKDNTVASNSEAVTSSGNSVTSEVTAEPINLLQEGLEVAGYLLILMVFAVVVIRLGKRFQPNMGASGLIRVEDGHNLAPGVGVRLISVGSRAWLVGVTKERVSLLAEMSQEEMQTAKEGSA
ncbi:MAG: flagellar biosynthetic protein FliO [Magnetococcales bacterium]|nr:flagellar biosynthetic protein FliO [Magnetococcales bacterium]